ncbi:hypothetical protein NUH88_08940 [Nisaea acidiphila]|uniref:Uncharacterized protein n=1 Tax=Nisaea acidiphila TaxID=1862145 RepID=A0A9J7B2C4_9PROT|nr:hypothetical protein [Nisaea acidiphila]UUX51813.1 hypothetical protein NUH88_08940 [Nisaea acidiphila]
MWIIEDGLDGTATGVRWDPLETAATLSDGDRVASYSNFSPVLVGRGTRSVTGKTGGKWYVEIRSLYFRPDRVFCGFDIDGDQDLFSDAPTDFVGPATMASTTPFASTVEAVTVDASGTPIELACGDAIALALDLDAGKLWIGALNPWEREVSWHGAADPASGSGAQFTALPAGTYHLFCALTANDEALHASMEIPEIARGRPPGGFTVW